jgi:hypothetical protein
MLTLTQAVETFPSVRIPSHGGGLPVEVSLISQMGIGSGDALIAGAMARQRGHDAYIDALEEPSARLGGVDLGRGDATSLYSFAVGAAGHPFHRHAGHRVFTAVSGSAGAQLRFSTASPAQIEADAGHFVRALQQVNIPPDSLFVVRFGGETWHQFVPLHRRTAHPALFALSCHTDELGGDLPAGLRDRIAANEADIPSLTEVLPAELRELLARLDPRQVPTTALSLHEAPSSVMSWACAVTRGFIGPIRAFLTRLRMPRGFLANNGGGRAVTEHRGPSADSLLRTQLADGPVDEDTFTLELSAPEVGNNSSADLLEAVLDGFLENRPLAVSRMMAFRNVLVKPLGLRTSPLGCPVSSLLTDKSRAVLFRGRFPVLQQRESRDGSRAEVILGADDKHLKFRSCVGVVRHGDGTATVSLGTRVRTTNWFGAVYMALIDRTHKRFVSPTMLRLAVDYAVAQLSQGASHTCDLCGGMQTNCDGDAECLG